MSAIKKIGITAGILICGLLFWAYYPTFVESGVPLAFQIEGALDSKLNFRDAGLSVNQCAGQNLLPEGILFRASGFFSGWACDRVGDPEVIYSLNFSDEANKRYYCRADHDFKIGVSYQHRELSDLEFIRTWETNAEMTRDACAFLREGLHNLKIRRKTLFHCEAGRDRTGAIIAIIAAATLEEKGPLTDAQISAIECDYRKSKSLSVDKYGRVTEFLRGLRERGGVRGFIAEKCAWPRE